jgi:predicted NUDIX family phosphoesterase
MRNPDDGNARTKTEVRENMGDSAEQVLVIERDVFDRIGVFQGVCLNVEQYLGRLLAAGVPRYMLRSKAETDPTFKQLIPYVILTCEGRVLSYVRGSRAGETRLVGRRSIGIGGHINPPDELPLFDTDLRDAYLAAVAREVGEEVTLDGGHSDRVVGLLNDDTNEVGRVHLGIVHHWELQRPRVTKREQMMTQLAFQSIEELRADRESLETWSQHCLDQIEALTGLVETTRA